MAPNGGIRGNFEEVIDGITCLSRLTQVLIQEDYDDVDAWETIHSDKYQKEFIFKLMEHMALGGSLCQHSDMISDYLDVVKMLYKDLISVAKDTETGQIRSHSFAFKIEKIEGYNFLYNNKEDDHPQNFFYVVVDPINWHVNFLHHRWVAHW